MNSKEEAKRDNNNYFTNDFSKEIWASTYRFNDEHSIEDTWRRVSKAVAEAEVDDNLKKEWSDKFFNLLKDFKFIPGGRILSNVGSKLSSTAINCFISGKPDFDIDSIEGILEVLRIQALTLASEGGYGLNFGFIRPRGSYVKGRGIRTPGAVKYMELFDKSSEIITEGPGDYELEFEKTEGKPKDEKKKIRKGAQMFLYPIWGADVLEFIKAKRIPGRLTKANLSVQVTNEFMDKLIKILELKKTNPEEADKIDKWELIFPDTSHKAFKKEWFGNIDDWRSKGYPVKVYKTVKLTELWETIMKSTYNFNDPGVLFTDIANETCLANYLGQIQYIDTSNPCLPGWVNLKTPEGLKRMDDIRVGDVIWSKEGWTTVINKINQGVKPVFSYHTHSGKIYATENHKFVQNGIKTEARNCSSIDLVTTFDNSDLSFSKLDKEYIDKGESFSACPLGHIPLSIRYSDKIKVASFIKGIFNNSNEITIDESVTYKLINPDCMGDLQILLSSLGIITTVDKCTIIIDKRSDNEFNRIFFDRGPNYLDLNGESYRDAIIASYDQGSHQVYDITVNNESHTFWCNGFDVSNCGEVTLSAGASCLLSSWNFAAYVKVDKENKPYFDFDALSSDIEIGTRFMDNVATITKMPLPVYKETLENYRRIGMGILGLGSALMILGLKYGSKESLEFIDKVMNIINSKALATSANLAGEKGPYKDCDWKKHFDNIKKVFPKLSKDQLKEIEDAAKKSKGFRNASMFAVPPTGNTGCLANNTSGGLEPIFSITTIRTVGVPEIPESLKDKVPSFWEGDMTPNGYFKLKENWGIKYLEYKEPETGIVYKIIKDRGLCKEVEINDYAAHFIKEHNLDESLLDQSQTAQNLSIEDHLSVLQEIAEHQDMSSSKTINCDANISYEDFKDIYLTAYKGKRIKGVTTFRDGTRMAVLTAKDNKKDEENKSDIKQTSCKIQKTNAPKRPKTLPCNLHLMTINKEPWYAIVSMLGEDPYEVFIGKNEIVLSDDNGEYIGKKLMFKKQYNECKDATLTKQAKGKYLFKCGDFEHLIERDKSEPDDVAIITAFSRVMSCGLRHGCDIAYLVQQLEKTAGSFACPTRVFSRVLKKYIKDNTVVSGEKCPECGSKIIRREGCKVCSNCSWSACN